jgi:uncharacterized protein YbbK (DUF523 family)
MSRFPYPIVVVSNCLGFAACRWNGEIVPGDGFLERLTSRARIITVCPEVEIGLGVPRDKIRLVRVTTRQGSGARFDPLLVQPATGRDLTDDIQNFAREFLATLEVDAVDGFILKSRSPSCGIRDTKIFADSKTDDVVDLGAGLFAAAVLDAMALRADLPVEDETRLADREIRRVFLTNLFQRARTREATAVGAPLHSELPPVPPELLE